MSIEERAKQLNRGTFEKKSYPVEEVCEILGTTRQTINKLINHGNIQAVMLERGWRIIKKSFDEWLDNE